MGRVLHKLSALSLSKTNKPGLYSDGGGLYLQVSPTGTKSWIYRFQSSGRQRDMGLGSARDVSLAKAREAASTARTQVREGVDPIAARVAARQAVVLASAGATTFAKAAEEYVADHKSGWRNRKHAAQWASTLKCYANPTIGSLSVQEVDVHHVLRILKPIWSTKTETARRVRGRIEKVLDWSTAKGLRKGENPARWRGVLEHLLPTRPLATLVQHHPALPYSMVPSFMTSLKMQPGEGARALEFVILTGARSGEGLGARWDEFDLHSGIWTVPPARSKTGRAHRVPLSTQALEVLTAQASRWGTDGFVFRAHRKTHPLSNMAMAMVIRRMRSSGAVSSGNVLPAFPHITVHGFRSTFRDWAAEQTDYPAEVAEMALAHVVADKVEAAYRRGDLLRKRFLFMEDWGAYCCGLAENKGTGQQRKVLGTCNEQAEMVA